MWQLFCLDNQNTLFLAIILHVFRAAHIWEAGSQEHHLVAPESFFMIFDLRMMSVKFNSWGTVFCTLRWHDATLLLHLLSQEMLA